MELDRDGDTTCTQSSDCESDQQGRAPNTPSNPVHNLTKFHQYDKAEEQLKTLLNSLKSVTAKEDLIKSLRWTICKSVSWLPSIFIAYNLV